MIDWFLNVQTKTFHAHSRWQQVQQCIKLTCIQKWGSNEKTCTNVIRTGDVLDSCMAWSLWYRLCQKMKVYMQLIVFTTARIFYFIASCFHFSCQVQLNFIVYFSIIFPESIYVAKWLQSSTFDPRSGFTDHSITSVLSHDTAEKMPKVTINTIDKTSISWSEWVIIN